MKIIKLLSIMTMLVILAAISFTLVTRTGILPVKPKQSTLIDSLNSQLDALKEHSVQSSGDTISKKELYFQLNEMKNTAYLAKSENTANKADTGFSKETFWIKVVFSGIFCLAALFVILSQKYDAETKKWAFSVMTLIAGVWIGTIS